MTAGWERWLPYLIAGAIGLLVGIEREKAHTGRNTMGVRTFLLMSLLGALAGDMRDSWVAILLTSFTLGLIVVSYFTQTNTSTSKVDRGLTTEVAAGVVFALAFVAHESPALSAILGPAVAVILYSKKTLHRFTNAIKPAELEAGLMILLAGVVVIYIVPDKIVDPWGIFNPRKFGYIILTLAVLEFLSYALAKAVGEKNGALIAGFFGGFVSSTAILLSSARQAQSAPKKQWSLVSTALAAKLAAFIQLFFIVGLVSFPLLLRVGVPAGAGFLVGTAALFIVARKKEQASAALELRSPLDWRGVLRLSFVLGAILALISAAKIWFGDMGTFTLSFVTGFFELHGVSLANATMYSSNQISLEAASTGILLATIGSLVAKTVIAWMIGGFRFARALAVVFVPMIVAIALSWMLI